MMRAVRGPVMRSGIFTLLVGVMIGAVRGQSMWSGIFTLGGDMMRAVAVNDVVPGIGSPPRWGMMRAVRSQ